MSDKIQNIVLAAIDERREQIVKFLQDLIRFPSVTGKEEGIQDFIANYLANMNLEVDKWEPDLEELKKHSGYVAVDTDYKNRPNVVGSYRGNKSGRSLLFNGHVDVIPAVPLVDWSHDPWAAEIAEGRIYGRGSSDMKAGLAAMTMALKIVLKIGLFPKGDVMMEYTVDEELSGNGTLACILRGYKADAGISCETSSLDVQPASIGRIWFEINVKGKPTGIQRRWEGVSAIEKGYQILQAVSDFERIRVERLRHPLYPSMREAVPCAIGVFNAGIYPSAFPSYCSMKGSIATLPGEDSDEVKQRFRDHILTVAQSDSWLRYNLPEVSWKGYFAEPAEMPANHPICTSVTRNFELVTGKKAIVSGRTGAADTRHLMKFANTPTVIFGPGLTSQMHATNEWVGVEELIIATKTLALSILDWCGYEM